MTFDKELIAGKLRRWERYLDEYRLPAWEQLPNIGLYMEQVVILIRQYLNYFPSELREEQVITPAAINNYVRKKVMPVPVKKKYYRIHIAYLIMICTLKHCLAIPTLKTMIPMGLSEEEMREVYTAYVERHRMACTYFVRQVHVAAGGILNQQTESEITTNNTGDLISMAAVISGLARLMAEKLLLLEGKDLANGGSVEDFPYDEGI